MTTGGTRRCFRWLGMRHLCAIVSVLCIIASALSVWGYIKDSNHMATTTVTTAPTLPTNHTQAYGDLMWFMQVSDLHLTTAKPVRGTDLKQFITRTVQAIVKPQFVLATGDITDAWTGERIHKVDEPSWREYSTILNDTGVAAQPNFWLDVRGNHDMFHVPGYESDKNYYRRYGASRAKFGANGAPYGYTYDWISPVSGGTVRIVMMDAVANFGLARTFNYLVHIRREVVDALSNALAMPWTGPRITTFVAGHYPLGSATMAESSTGKTITQLARDAGTSAYLCGHYHLAKNYYHRPDNTLELELEDWKEGRKYRIVAVDNGVFSFTDHTANDWPHIHILSPKDNRFLVEPDDTASLRSSTAIRVLVWSDFPVTNVDVLIDGLVACQRMSRSVAGQPLFVCSWTPASYATGDHTITVTATDGGGKMKTTSLIFNLEGRSRSLGAHFQNYFGGISLPWLWYGLTIAIYSTSILLMLWVPKGFIWYLKHTGAGGRKVKQFNYQITEMLLAEDNGYRYEESVPHGGCARLWLWQWRVHLWQYGNLATAHWLFLSLAWIWVGVGPLLFGPISDSTWGMMTSWCVVDNHGNVHYHPETGGVAVAVALFKLLPLSSFLARTVLSQHTATAVAHRVTCKHRMFWTSDVITTLFLYVAGIVMSWTVVATNFPVFTLLFAPAALWIDICAVYVFVSTYRAYARGSLLPGELAVSDIPPYGNYGDDRRARGESEKRRRARDDIFAYTELTTVTSDNTTSSPASSRFGVTVTEWSSSSSSSSSDESSSNSSSSYTPPTTTTGTVTSS